MFQRLTAALFWCSFQLLRHLVKSNSGLVTCMKSSQQGSLDKLFKQFICHWQFMAAISVHVRIQWNLSMKQTLSNGHPSIKGTAGCPNTYELCTKLPLNQRHLSIKDRQLGPVLYMVSPIERFLYFIHIYRIQW